MTNATSDPERDERLRALLEAWYEREESGSDPDLTFLRDEDPVVVERFARLIGRSGEVIRTWSTDKKLATGELPVDSLGPYRLMREIGSGGMGRVYAAEDASLGRPVALKLLHGGPHATPVQRARFRREAEITAALEHPNIVPIYAVGEEGPWVYIAMKWLDGQSLGELAPMAPREVARVGMEIAAALQEAHANGILHRDVKPSNVIMDGDVPVLLDFGLARAVESSSLTREDVVPGTLPYMAPEQLTGDLKLDPRADVYSLGATLYELATGRPPYDSSQPRDSVMRQIVERDVAAPGLPRSAHDLETILLRALDKDRRRRFRTADAMREDLERFRDGRPIASRRIGPITRGVKLFRRHRRAASAVVVMAIAALVLLSIVVVQAVQEENALTRDIATVDDHLEQGRLGAAANVLGTAARRHANDRRVLERRERLAAREALEDLLDGLLSFSTVRNPGRVPELLTTIEAVDADHLPRPTVDLARALAHLHRRDRDAALAILDTMEADGYHGRAGAALRCAATDEPLALPEPSPDDPKLRVAEQHVFTAMVMSIVGTPLDEQWAEVERAFEAAPFAYRVLLARARVLLDRNDAAHARGILEALHRDGLRRPVVAYCIGLACLQTGDLPKARWWYERTSYRGVLRDSARADLLRHENSDEYAAFVEEAAEKWPRDPHLLRLLGQVRNVQARYRDAIDLFEKAHRYALAATHRTLIEVRLAEVRYQALQVKSPVPPKDELAPIAADLSGAIARRPAPYVESAALYLLGRIREVTHGPEEAMEHLARAYAVDPDHEAAVYSHARLLTTEIIRVARKDGLEEASDVYGEDATAALDALERHLAAGRFSQKPADVAWLGVVLAAAHPRWSRLERAVARFDEIEHPIEARRKFRDWFVKNHPDR